jgi:hypothetical protein
MAPNAQTRSPPTRPTSRSSAALAPPPAHPLPRSSVSPALARPPRAWPTGSQTTPSQRAPGATGRRPAPALARAALSRLRPAARCSASPRTGQVLQLGSQLWHQLHSGRLHSTLSPPSSCPPPTALVPGVVSTMSLAPVTRWRRCSRRCPSSVRYATHLEHAWQYIYASRAPPARKTTWQHSTETFGLEHCIHCHGSLSSPKEALGGNARLMAAPALILLVPFPMPIAGIACHAPEFKMGCRGAATVYIRVSCLDASIWADRPLSAQPPTRPLLQPPCGHTLWWRRLPSPEQRPMGTNTRSQNSIA